MIADLTYRRPSVYFDVGYGHGLGINTLLTCREDHQRGAEDGKMVHFDLARYRISRWKLSKAGEVEWEKKLSIAARLRKISQV